MRQTERKTVFRGIAIGKAHLAIVQLMSRTEKALLTVSRIKRRKRKRKGRTFPQIGEKK